MLETFGEDIFDKIDNADAICIPTNCSIDAFGKNPMGALAGQFARRWNELPGIYGRMLMFIPNVPVILGYINRDHKNEFASSLDDHYLVGNKHTAVIAFPTMHYIMERANFNLVIRSATILVELANLYNWNNIYLGCPGVGVGGLPIDEVKSSLKEIFDDRFTVMIK